MNSRALYALVALALPGAVGCSNSGQVIRGQDAVIHPSPTPQLREAYWKTGHDHCPHCAQKWLGRDRHPHGPHADWPPQRGPQWTGREVTFTNPHPKSLCGRPNCDFLNCYTCQAKRRQFDVYDAGDGWYPTHFHHFDYRPPQGLTYPQDNQPAAIVQYPYYTVKGPSDFFMK